MCRLGVDRGRTGMDSRSTGPVTLKQVLRPESPRRHGARMASRAVYCASPFSVGYLPRRYPFAREPPELLLLAVLPPKRRTALRYPSSSATPMGDLTSRRIRYDPHGYPHAPRRTRSEESTQDWTDKTCGKSGTNVRLRESPFGNALDPACVFSAGWIGRFAHRNGAKTNAPPRAGSCRTRAPPFDGLALLGDPQIGGPVAETTNPELRFILRRVKKDG
jgi:hypothetical protein